jgi:hypothetical protein
VLRVVVLTAMNGPSQHDQDARERPGERSQRGMPQGAADQPRPALGRRPWLALERRARSLRRFFFAITGGRVPPSPLQPSSAQIVDRVSGWSTPPVVIARTARRRFAGARGRVDPHAVLIGTRAVHGFGLRIPLGAVGIGPKGRVLRLEPLKPRGVVRLADCRWILELPASHPPPPMHARLVWRRPADVE